MIYFIYSNHTGGMDNFIIGHDNATMTDLSVFILEKGKIAGQRFFNKIYGFSEIYLLDFLSGKAVACDLEYDLSKTCAINTQWLTPAP